MHAENSDARVCMAPSYGVGMEHIGAESPAACTRTSLQSLSQVTLGSALVMNKAFGTGMFHQTIQ